MERDNENNELLKAPSLLKCAMLVINVAIAVFLVVKVRASGKGGGVTVAKQERAGNCEQPGLKTGGVTGRMLASPP